MNTRITLTAEQLDVLDDAVAYYLLAGMGGGEDEPDSSREAELRRVQAKIERARGGAA